jgi:hypothetical protein
MPDDTDWLIMGDFNFIRNPNDRNKPGGNITEMLQFNEAISNLGLIEIPFKGRKFTWSNMQADPCWKSLIGFSLLPHGQILILLLLLHPWRGQHLIIITVLFPLAQKFQRQGYSGLKTIG